MYKITKQKPGKIKKFFLTFCGLSLIIKIEKRRENKTMKKEQKIYKVVDRRDGTVYMMTAEDAVNATIHDWNLDIVFDDED